MVSEKYLRIISTRREGTLAERCRDILDKVGKGRIALSVVFFIDAPTPESFISGEKYILKECRSFFGKALPMVTCVAQKPLGSTLTSEVLFLSGDATVEYNDDYLVIRNGKQKELISKGIRFLLAGDSGAQSHAVFSRIGEILDSEGFKIDEIVRQWNYIEGITQINGGIQNYQMFNDARSGFYSHTDWPGGYPAATGIGCASGGVSVSVYAVKGALRLSHPIDNPLQVPAHKYSGKVLVAGKEAQKTTPKFERARLLGESVLVSGTAAIKGENSEMFSDPSLQTKAAIEVVESLVAPGNICPGNKRFRFNSLRVYIKREKDADAIISTLKSHWGTIPMHFMIADICRPELLLEIEGTGTVIRFLECCCVDAEEAVEAQAGGAGRIELCENLPCGGVTPSRKNIEATLASVNIPVNVLVRPRGGDFVYDEAEVESMLAAIKMCGELGVNGVVIGALRSDGSVDMDVMRRLISSAGGMEITFHRAFDECADPFTSLENIISLGCDRLLTAGHASNVNDGAGTLKDLQAKAAGRIVIMAGSGVRPGNIASLEASSGITEFHSSSHGPEGRTDRMVVSEMVHIIDRQ
ncbi:MAG: hypothetical protein IKW99_02485 [Bacteroidales bacterium]|nr:hypothetical protein [Bacteroidales bacterium]